MTDAKYGPGTMPARPSVPNCIDQEFDEIYSVTGEGMPELDLFAGRFVFHDPIHTIAH